MPAAILVCLVLLSAWLMPGSAGAHSRASTGELADGVEIATLSHGQMAIIAPFRDDILDLASRRINTGETFRRLVNFANIQFSACLWGLVPGAIRDEASPFNECSHAYLAASREVLMRMRATPGDASAVHALVDDIERRMQLDSTSLELCRYSGMTFNTADVMQPHWQQITQHPTSLATFAGLGFALAGAGVAVGRIKPSQPRADPSSQR